MQATVNSLVTAVTNCTNIYMYIYIHIKHTHEYSSGTCWKGKHTTLFVPFVFVAAQIVTVSVVMYGNLIQFNLLVCCPALLNVFHYTVK